MLPQRILKFHDPAERETSLIFNNETDEIILTRWDEDASYVTLRVAPYTIGDPMGPIASIPPPFP